MGGFSSKQSEIVVATLNYAGITYSPFQFYSGDEADSKELQILSNIFQELASKENILPRINQSWDLKAFDTTMQRQRYCPLFRQDVGIMRGRLMNREEFLLKWQQEYDKNKHYVKFKQAVNQKQQKKCKMYDYIIFKTFVEYIYNYKIEKRQDKPLIIHGDRVPAQETKEQRKKMKQTVIQYQLFLEKHFDKKYLKHQTKLEAVLRILQTKDVVFLQDASDELINSIKNEGKITIVAPPDTRDCAILLKKDKFEKIYDEQKIFESEELRHKELLKLDCFSYNKPKSIPAVAFVDNFLFISLHLHSSDGEDVAKMMEHLINLNNNIPQLTIVLGGDFNRFIGKQQSILNSEDKAYKRFSREFFQKFSIYPKTNDTNNLTTKKKRTWLQTQRKKANDPDQSCRDFIITSVQPIKCRREVLGQRVTSETRLLTDQHPFDHFIVSAVIPKQFQPPKRQ